MLSKLHIVLTITNKYDKNANLKDEKLQAFWICSIDQHREELMLCFLERHMEVLLLAIKGIK